MSTALTARADSPRRWSAVELAVLVADYEPHGINHCAALLPSRSATSIRNKASRLGLCRVIHMKRRLVSRRSG